MPVTASEQRPRPTVRGFDWKVIGLAGLAGGVLYALLHTLFVQTDADFTDFGAFIGVLLRYFALVIVGFVAIGLLANKRRPTTGLTFMDCLVHSIVMTLVWLLLNSGFEFAFATQRPTYMAELVESKVVYFEALHAQNDSVIAKLRNFGPEAHNRSEQNKLIQANLPILQERARILRATEPSFLAILQDLMISYLIMGIVWGIITGVVFMRRG